MAGSYQHCTNADGSFIGERFATMIENLGDAHEACEEMHWMINFLAGGDRLKIERAALEFIVQQRVARGEDEAAARADLGMTPMTTSIVRNGFADRMAAKRVSQAKDCREVSPTDLLRTMARDIEVGEIKVDGLVLIWMWRPDDEPWDAGTYRCNMGSDQELVAIELAKERCIRKWLNRSS